MQLQIFGPVVYALDKAILVGAVPPKFPELHSVFALAIRLLLDPA